MASQRTMVTGLVVTETRVTMNGMTVTVTATVPGKFTITTLRIVVNYLSSSRECGG
jgi:hypothetical protein